MYISEEEMWWRYLLELFGYNVGSFFVRSMFQKDGRYIMDNKELIYRN